MSNARINLGKAWPQGKTPLFALTAAIAESGLDRRLTDLINIRASQINQCAFCLDMHTKDARAAGETEQRIYALNAWRETPFFTDEERAVLALTEEITLIADGGVDDEVWAAAAKHFDEPALGRIVMAIVAINAWNRLGVTQRLPVGGYQPARS
ncbi:carboxymuconolactone decarboxylase family protein [Kibdelosporangium phytohabitans]|uniref:Carboxymuconolactone decarboxylase n=1 Tax=Kibdelosporangium phytohabitans TaxID=860235 RepID=A0A0N9HZB0_9PSEU|nr:carboxymuconolactone decarboxylase family protein [Kibdelosporangium phytohabitans]ALG08708.1 carboxymuconolactone decarboxylase [Kibdelosporangium phytohabitans]MBE1470181.1 AhpD family alkylhydroperoxidase [Kibdelosporangium phytohabitans]